MDHAASTPVQQTSVVSEDISANSLNADSGTIAHTHQVDEPAHVYRRPEPADMDESTTDGDTIDTTPDNADTGSTTSESTERVKPIKIEEVARGIARALGCTEREQRDLANVVQEISGEEEQIAALFQSLYNLSRKHPAGFRWTPAEPTLRDLLARCFGKNGAELIAPAPGERFEIELMNDLTTSLYGKRSVVRRMLVPGFRTATIIVKASVETE